MSLSTLLCTTLAWHRHTSIKSHAVLARELVATARRAVQSRYITSDLDIREDGISKEDMCPGRGRGVEVFQRPSGSGRKNVETVCTADRSTSTVVDRVMMASRVQTKHRGLSMAWKCWRANWRQRRRGCGTAARVEYSTLRFSYLEYPSRLSRLLRRV
jgi:hypothetical protein